MSFLRESFPQYVRKTQYTNAFFVSPADEPQSLCPRVCEGQNKRRNVGTKMVMLIDYNSLFNIGIKLYISFTLQNTRNALLSFTREFVCIVHEANTDKSTSESC